MSEQPVLQMRLKPVAAVNLLGEMRLPDASDFRGVAVVWAVRKLRKGRPVQLLLIAADEKEANERFQRLASVLAGLGDGDEHTMKMTCLGKTRQYGSDWSIDIKPVS